MGKHKFWPFKRPEAKQTPKTLPNLLSPSTPDGATSSRSSVSAIESVRSVPGTSDNPAPAISNTTAETATPTALLNNTANSTTAALASPVTAENDAPLADSLWDHAYDALKVRHSELIEVYEDFLSKSLHQAQTPHPDHATNVIPQGDAAARRQKMDTIIALGLEHAADKETSVTIAGQKITVEEAIAKTAGVVSWAEDYIKDTVKDLPYASIVMVGVSLVLPLLKNPVVAEEARSTGFTYVTSQMRYYAAMESLLLPEDMESVRRADLASRLTDLYSLVIEFQIRCVIHLYRSRTKNFFRGAIHYDDWKGTLASIKSAEQDLDTKFFKAQSAQSVETLRWMQREAEESRRRLDSTMDEIVQLMREQLGVAARMDRRMELAEDRACIEALSKEDPRDDKARILSQKGGLLEDSYRWVFTNEDFQQWRRRDNGLLWLRGDPGKGKTMLVCAIIDKLEASAWMVNVCYFFCQATDERISSGTAVLRGLIHMLVKQQPSLMPHLRKAYEEAKLVEGRNAWVTLSQLFDKIVNDHQLEETHLLIDALDECTTDLTLLLELVDKYASHPRIKWLVSSRNELAIAERLDRPNIGSQLSLELNAASVSLAVRSFIQHKVGVLKALKGYTQNQQDRVSIYLADNASDTFLWVALVCQHLSILPRGIVLDTIKRGLFPSGLKDLYRRMLHQVNGTDFADLCIRILAVVCTVYRPITIDELPSMVDLPDDLAEDSDALQEILNTCGSFISTKGGVIATVHQSAVDFLKDQASDEIFPAGPKDVHHKIFIHSLDSLSAVLRRDIYNLVDPGYKFQNIQRPDPDPLASVGYLSAYWVDHLGECLSLSEETEVIEMINQFMKAKYLYWIEALGLLGKISQGVQSIAKLKELTLRVSDVLLRDTVHDAERFLRYFKVAVELAPLQIYVSGLLFSPTNSFTRKNFHHDRIGRLSLASPISPEWSACIQTLEGHSDWVNSVIFSPDGKSIASGSDDNTVRIWDAVAGHCKHIIEGHSNSVTLVIFSPDSKSIASGSHDKTVRIWDAVAGHCKHILEGHSDSVTSVIFSPDGKSIASGSDDDTVRIWDAMTGSCKHIIEGHSGWITSVIFSPDSKSIASGSHDNRVRIWDAMNGHCKRIIEGHSNSVTSVIFSPDGKSIASGSDDDTVRIWDAMTGSCKHILEGHSGWVTSAIFSPDGKSIASSSDDNTVRIWDAVTGHCKHILEGHSDSVTSVIFSPDSKSIASGSHDKTVRIWDSVTGHCKHILEGHGISVTLVIFSPDSKSIASGSHDKTVRIWDSVTGHCKHILEGHGISVTSVIFSPDRRPTPPLELQNNIELDIGGGDDWILVDGSDSLWLPAEYRPIQFVVKGSHLALGCASGRVMIFHISAQE
ncbi:hypothetical protein VHEMI09337 [[Torrubiella] hemipterigena]|uniref:NACHT domain-containing protein n=1 Tax=[Torrubiella] hemipterigena TaxID=1531966 RepID=A0A0A1TQ63_9HYPO|nr:hypothetical protein VHEMI09337 [[Torrubiella] hemipterigena]